MFHRIKIADRAIDVFNVNTHCREQRWHRIANKDSVRIVCVRKIRTAKCKGCGLAYTIDENRKIKKGCKKNRILKR